MSTTWEHVPTTSMDAERRQITVVFVDIVGSSRLAEILDPEDFGNVIIAYRRAALAAIEDRGGFVARYLGDGILAYWGYPKVREQDPRRAVAAGLAIVAAIDRLNRELPNSVQLSVRIGIDSGIVVVGQLGQPSGPATADIVGEAPNIAARVQGLAEPNTVFITDTVHALVEWQFQFASRGRVQLKGLDSAVTLYQVLAERHPFERRPARSDRIYDRELEQANLDSCWRNVLNGRGQVILITGEPGIGKTTLVNYFRRTVEATHGTCLHDTCFAEGASAALLPIRDLLRQAIGIAMLDDIATMRSKLDGVAAGSRFDRDTVNQILLPLLDPTSSDVILVELTANERKRRIFEFLLNWILAYVYRAPLAIVIEDLQWADSTSMEFIELLSSAAINHAFCLLLTWRSNFRITWAERADVIHIEAMRLKDETIEALVASMTDNRIDAKTKTAIAAKAEGNPLFAEELVQLAFHARVGQEPGVLTLPSSLNDLLLARLDGLGELKPIAQVAAVIGREFDERVLADVLEMSPAELTQKLEILLPTGLVVDRGIGVRTSHSFKHALVRDAAYSSLLKANRRSIHAKTAQILSGKFPQIAESQPDLVAHHYEMAEMVADAITWWTKAGEQAGRQSATMDSIRLLERALTLFSRLPGGNHSTRKAEVLNLLGAQYLAAYGNASPALEKAFSEAVAILESQPEEMTTPLFAAFWGLHTYQMVRANLPRAIEIGVRMLAIGERDRDPDKILQANRVQGLARLLTGNHSEAAHHYREVLNRYDPSKHESHRFRYGSDPAAVVLAQFAWSEWIVGRFASSEGHATEGAVHARGIGHPHSIVHAVGVNALRLLTTGEVSASAEAAREARNLAERHGFPYWIAWCDIILAAVECSIEASHRLVLLNAAIENYQRTGARQLVPYALGLKAECCLALDRPIEAADILNEGISLVEETGVRLYEAELLRLQACAASKAGWSNADALFNAALDVARRQGARSFELRSLMSRLQYSTFEAVSDVVRTRMAEVLDHIDDQPETVETRAARRLLGEEVR